MRTIKASEVIKGMRVRVSKESHGVITTVEGEVTQVWTRTNLRIIFADGSHKFLGSDHPVTVLAEPDPEWVEGAWYRLQVSGNETIARRVEAGWVRWGHVSIPSWEDSDLSRTITVLGRVLIVDWPGDDAARAIERTYTLGGNWIATENTAAQIIADAIRTQGGAP